MNKTRWQTESVREVIREAGSRWSMVLDRAVDLSHAHRLTAAKSGVDRRYARSGEGEPLYTDTEADTYSHIRKSMHIKVAGIEYATSASPHFKRRRRGARWENKYTTIVCVPNVERENVLEKMARIGSGDPNRYFIDHAEALAHAVLDQMLASLSYYEESALDLNALAVRRSLQEYIEELAAEVGRGCPLVYLPRREEPENRKKASLEEKIDRASSFYKSTRETHIMARAISKEEWHFRKACSRKDYWADKLRSYGQTETASAPLLSDVLMKLAEEYRSRGK